MSVTEFDPKKDTAASIASGPNAGKSSAAVAASAVAGVTVTDAAKAHIANQLAQAGTKQVRLGVKESGCNGFMYTLDFVESGQADDVQVPVDDALSLVVSEADMALVGGTQIDLVTEGLNSALRFKNPNAESHCGCGESFSIASA